MPIYEYRCLECGEVFSLLVLHAPEMRLADQSAVGGVGGDQSAPTDEGGMQGEGSSIQCSACGSGQTQRLMSSFAIGGRADPGPGRAAWPTSWDDTNGADPETLRYWRRRIEREARLEEKYPELRQGRPQGSPLPRDEGGMQGEGQPLPEGGTEHSHDEYHHHHQHNHVEPGGTSSTEHS